MTLRLSEKSFQTKHCKVCRGAFYPFRSTDQTCPDTACKREWIRQRELKKAARATRKELREYRARTKTIAKLIAEAQHEFNHFIRERDWGKPCICCGRLQVETAFTGGAWDAGHYRSTGAAPHLRFNEDNCHRQLKFCNQQRSGNVVDYRLGLIARIGLARVEAVEQDNRTVKWSRDELVAIRRKYLGMWKALRAKREAA